MAGFIHHVAVSVSYVVDPGKTFRCHCCLLTVYRQLPQQCLAQVSSRSSEHFKRPFNLCGRWPIVRPWTICCNPYCPSPLVSAASQHRARAAYRWAVDVTVYIRESERRTGVGHTLYEALLPILTRQGFRSAYAGISQPNAGSVALHERFGFRHIGTYPNVGYILGRWHDVGY